MKYDKVVPTKKNRLLSASGPRDIQRRQILGVQSELVDELKTQVTMLQEQVVKSLSSVSSDCKYTAEQVNEAVINAVKSEVESLKSKYESMINGLEMENKILRETNIRLSSRSENGNNLTEAQLQKIISTAMVQISENKQIEIIEETKRPKIETVFIDPLDNRNVNEMETHIKVKEDHSSKEKMNDKLSKLKNIMGKKV
jgi:hypothetical protein